MNFFFIKLLIESVIKVKVISCPLCKAEIKGADEDALLKNGLAHAKEAGHRMPTKEEIEQMRKLVKNA